MHANRFEVDQNRRFVAKRMQPVKRNFDTQTPCNDPATAVRWMIPLVDPPSAKRTRWAFSTDSSVMTWLGLIGDVNICAARGFSYPETVSMDSPYHSGSRQAAYPRFSRCRPWLTRCPSRHKCRMWS